MQENVDFQLVPGEDYNQQSWHVRFLTGDYAETVIAYGNVGINGKTDNLSFAFRIVSSPIEELSTEDTALQDHAADVLQALIADAIKNNTAVIREREDDNQH